MPLPTNSAAIQRTSTSLRRSWHHVPSRLNMPDPSGPTDGRSTCTLLSSCDLLVSKITSRAWERSRRPMSQPASRRSGRRSTPELIAVFDRETRRMGSMATLHNHAVADYVGPPPDRPGVHRPARLDRPAHRGRDRRPPRADQRRRHRARRPPRGGRVGAAASATRATAAASSSTCPPSGAPSCGRSTSPRRGDQRVPRPARRQGPAGRRRVPRVRQRDDRRGHPSRRDNCAPSAA